MVSIDEILKTAGNNYKLKSWNSNFEDLFDTSKITSEDQVKEYSLKLSDSELVEDISNALYFYNEDVSILNSNLEKLGKKLSNTPVSGKFYYLLIEPNLNYCLFGICFGTENNLGLQHFNFYEFMFNLHVTKFYYYADLNSENITWEKNFFKQPKNKISAIPIDNYISFFSGQDALNEVKKRNYLKTDEVIIKAEKFFKNCQENPVIN